MAIRPRNPPRLECASARDRLRGRRQPDPICRDASHRRAPLASISLRFTSAAGAPRVQALGLDNLELMSGDIAHLDLARAWASSTSSSAHGVYSWVPAERAGRDPGGVPHAAGPQGVAYVSYNAYPGWKAKEIVRDAMLLSVRRQHHPGREGASTRAAWSTSSRRWPTPDSVLARALADYQGDGRRRFRGLLPAARGAGDVQHAVLLPRLRGPCPRTWLGAISPRRSPRTCSSANYGPGRRRSSATSDLRQRSSARRAVHLDFVVNRMLPRRHCWFIPNARSRFRARSGSRSLPSSARRGVLAARRRTDSTRWTRANCTWRPGVAQIAGHQRPRCQGGS